MKLSLHLIVAVFIFGSLACDKQPAPVTAHHLILTSDPYKSLVQKEVEQYLSLYSGTEIEVSTATTREAIVHLLNDSVRCIVIDRVFNDEERGIAKQARIKIVENIISRDGIAVIVNKKNPIDEISTESVRRIITGDIKNWNEMKGTGWDYTLDLVLTGRNSGIYELLQKKFFSIQGQLMPAVIMETQDEVIRFVSEHPQAIGFAAASLVNNEKDKVKILSLKAKPDNSEKGYFPGQQEIYSSLYQFHYSLYLYNTESNTSLGVGFGAMMLSNIGQKIIQRSGLVPVSIPYRTIQLHAE